MAFSSVSVVTSSLLLRLYQTPSEKGAKRSIKQDIDFDEQDKKDSSQKNIDERTTLLSV